jgi:hypothetical protein
MFNSHTGGRPFGLCVGLLGLGFVASCASPKPPAATSVAATTPALWGDMKSVVSVKEFMRDLLDPASDNIFDAVKTVTTKSGTVDTLPKTDAEWEKLRVGAVTIAEGVYLLKVPRPFAPPGDENNSVGPDATELSPAQIEKKRAGDPVLWNAKIEALRNVGLEVLEIVKTKKSADLWQASYDLDQACEGCHIQYWYPGDTALLERVDRQLNQLYGTPIPGAPAAKTSKP